MSHIDRFREYHGLAVETDLECIRVSVDALHECHTAVQDELDGINRSGPREGFIIEAYGNLIAKTCEQGNGMLVCICTGMGPSAEALARVVIEGSVNLTFMSMNGLESPLLGYFENWLNQHTRKLTQWKEESASAETSTTLLATIEERQRLASALYGFLSSAEKELELKRQSPKETWPNSVFRRFELIGRKVDYITSYHRLSSASHMAAEETLMWLYSWGQSGGDPAVLERIGLEAVAYSRLMSQIAVLFFVDALDSFCVAMKLSRTRDKFTRHRAQMNRAILDTAERAGCPLKVG